jgi:plastocyanin
MRGSTLTSLGVLLAVASTAAAPDYADLRGTVRSRTQPETSAVVWLEHPGSRQPGRPGRVVLDQRNTAFVPRVLAVRLGTTIEFPNNDRVFHNGFSFHNGKRFDLGLYPVGAIKTEIFDRPGLSRVFCNIHPTMAAYIMVVDSPYFAVTNGRGEFVISAVEPGSYVYKAWRPGGPELTGSIPVDGRAALHVEWP